MWQGREQNRTSAPSGGYTGKVLFGHKGAYVPQCWYKLPGNRVVPALRRAVSGSNKEHKATAVEA